MAIRYQFIVSCKRAAETKWLFKIQSDTGDIPMSIVEPMSKGDGVLAAEPIVREVADPHVITSYLRQLNRWRSGQTTGNNDTVIWNITTRLLKLQIEQQIKVSVTYFEDKELQSGAYEILSQGVFPRVFPNKSLTSQSSSELFSPSTRPPARQHESSTITPAPKPASRTRQLLIDTKAEVSKSTAHSVGPATQTPSDQTPQKLGDIVANLVTYVEQLQQEFLTMKNTLQDQESRISAMHDRIRQLELENRQLHEISGRQDATSI